MEVDKIYCTEGRNDALLASVLGQRGNDPMTMAAMMNGGMNGAWKFLPASRSRKKSSKNQKNFCVDSIRN